MTASMDKIAAYEMLLEDHPLWTKEAGLLVGKAVHAGGRSLTSARAAGKGIPGGLKRPAQNLKPSVPPAQTAREVTTHGYPKTIFHNNITKSRPLALPAPR